MSTSPRDPARYLRPEGTLVPPDLAGQVFRMLVISVRDQVKSNAGGAPADPLVGLLEALHFSDVGHRQHGAARPAMSDSGPEERDPGTVVHMGTPSEAGQLVGMSARHVRRLCNAGVIRHQRVGERSYLVDLDDLQAHLRGRKVS